MAEETLMEEQSPTPPRPAPSVPPHPSRAGPIRLYKPGQGKFVRWTSAIGAAVIGLAGARWVHEELRRFRFLQGDQGFVIRTLIPVALVVFVAWLIVYLVGQRRDVVDFMIATEGEMKKVNWSSRREVLGATRVVIFTVLVLGLMLFVVDLLFMLVFSAIGVLHIPVWESLFGRGEQL